MSKFIVNPARTLSGTVVVPGDKSISHRALILASIADGTTFVEGFLAGEDTLSTLKALQAMGVKIEIDGNNVRIDGVGLWGLKKPSSPLYLGNSGTSMRLMAGLLAAQSFDSELIGDASLSNRPMARVIAPLSKMGAKILSNDNKPPLTIKGGQVLKGIDYILPVASAQVKSCLLLAGLYARGQTCITEPVATRDHTERMLKSFGYAIEIDNNKICLNGDGVLTANSIKVPADISAAAFFMVAASIAAKADISLIGVNINPTRTGIIDILKLMGADLTLSNERKIGGELLADIRVRAAVLQGINIPKNLVSRAIDEFPAIFIAAACAQGETVLTNAKELRVKESDRIQVMADGLSIFGIKTQVFADGIKIISSPLQKPNAIIQSHHDHRIAMSFAIASLRCAYPFIINGADTVKTSFPNFVPLANQVGMKLSISV